MRCSIWQTHSHRALQCTIHNPCICNLFRPVFTWGRVSIMPTTVLTCLRLLSLVLQQCTPSSAVLWWKIKVVKLIRPFGRKAGIARSVQGGPSYTKCHGAIYRSGQEKWGLNWSMAKGLFLSWWKKQSMVIDGGVSVCRGWCCIHTPGKKTRFIAFVHFIVCGLGEREQKQRWLDLFFTLVWQWHCNIPMGLFWPRAVYSACGGIIGL